jgi:hypothetical protein
MPSASTTPLSGPRPAVALVRALLPGLLPALAVACGEDSPAADERACDPTQESCTFQHRVATIDVGAGEERADRCVAWTLGNDADLWVQSVHLATGGAFHHSNWLWVPDTFFGGPDGEFACQDRVYDETAAAVVGGVLFAQSTQVADETQEFADGAAILVPARSRIIASVHLLNASSEDVASALDLTLRTVPAASVEHPLWPVRFNYGDLLIPAGGKSAHEGACDLASVHESLTGRPLELSVHWVLPHYHSLGTGSRLEVLGGPNDGATIYEESHLLGEPLGAKVGPVDVGVMGARGLRFRCDHDNPRSADVGFGIGDQEMCVMLAFIEGGARYDAQVTRTESSELVDGRLVRRGECSVLGAKTPDKLAGQ